MEALLVYASGSESDEPGEEQASGAEAEATEDIEANAEEQKFSTSTVCDFCLGRST
jgi:hypothetical protein